MTVPYVSMTSMFLSIDNINKISNELRNNSEEDMKKWANVKDLDDYESVTMDTYETLSYINKEFIKNHKVKQLDFGDEEGQNYPKYNIYDAAPGHDVNDWRSYDAHVKQEVFVTNSNFRYCNRVKKWETSLYKRHYDTDNHAEGLGDTRELYTPHKKYSMDAIYGKNQYESSDSIMYDF